MIWNSDTGVNCVVPQNYDVCPLLMMHKTCSINYGHLADLQKTLPTTSFQSVLVNLLIWQNIGTSIRYPPRILGCQIWRLWLKIDFRNPQMLKTHYQSLGTCVMRCDADIQSRLLSLPNWHIYTKYFRNPMKKIKLCLDIDLSHWWKSLKEDGWTTQKNLVTSLQGVIYNWNWNTSSLDIFL